MASEPTGVPASNRASHGGSPSRRAARARLIGVLALWLAVATVLLPFGEQGREPNVLIALVLTCWAAVRARQAFGRGESIAWSAGVGYGFYAASWGVQWLAEPLLHVAPYRPRWDLPIALAIIIAGAAAVMVRAAEREQRRRGTIAAGGVE